MVDPAAVDGYLESFLLPPDAVLAEVENACAAAGLPAIAVSRLQGRLLHLLARAIRAERILEIGTLGGYSATWLARALPAGGQLDTCEIDPRHAEVAAANLTRAGLDGQVAIHLGPAADTLARLTGPYDLVFIDADKESNADYVRAAQPLCRPGALLVVDNVVRRGAVADAADQTPMVLGVRRLLELLAQHPSLPATAVQTVGTKGHDGFLLALVAD